MSSSERLDLTARFDAEPGWFSHPGEDADVVISSRVRAARNLADLPFPAAMSDEQQAEFEGAIVPVLSSVCDSGSFRTVELDSADAHEQGRLRERNLLAGPDGDARPYLLALRNDEALSVAVNSRDHLRIAGIRSGRALRTAWHDVHECEAAFASHLRFAVNMEFGYLTREIENCGTGLRAGVLLHLPGLVAMQRLSSTLEELLGDRFRLKSFALVHDNGVSDAFPFSHAYQLSDRYSLGRSEDNQLGELEGAADELVRLERDARKQMFEEYGEVLNEAFEHALETLTTATELSPGYAISQLLALRFAVSCGRITSLDYVTITSLLFVVQKCHILTIGETYGEKVDVVRANLVRQILSRNLKQRG